MNVATQDAFSSLPLNSRQKAAKRLRVAIDQLTAVANALDGDVSEGAENPIGELAARVLRNFGITDGSEAR